MEPSSKIIGLDGLARYPEKPVLVVEASEQATAAAMFTGMVVIGVDLNVNIGKIGLDSRKVTFFYREQSYAKKHAETIAAKASKASYMWTALSPTHNPPSFFAARGFTGAACSKVLQHSLRHAEPQAQAPDPMPPPVNGKVTHIADARSRALAKPEPVPDAGELSPLSEDGLARIFTASHPELRYVAEWGQWLRWDNKTWIKDDTLHVFDLARKVCVSEADKIANTEGASKSAIAKCKSASTRAAIENLARSDRAHAATTGQWDLNPMLLNTPSGVIDLETGMTRPARMDDYLTRCTSVPIGDASKCQQWLAFLSCKREPELVAFLKRVAGYCLTGETREHALFFVYGSGGNGKGTFLNTLARVFGDYSKTASMETFTASRNDRHPQELASLRGSRLVVAQETEEGRHWAESRLKALTGGDPITARFMRQNEFTFQPNFKLIVAGNHKPGLRSVDEAIKRRLYLIPFTERPDTPDQGLQERLWDEAPHILAWALEGCTEWLRDGLAAPESVRVATEEYLDAEDSIGQWLTDCCIVDSGYNEKASVVYQSFRTWSEDRNEFCLSQKRFSQAMESRGHESFRSNGMKYRGICLKAS